MIDKSKIIEKVSTVDGSDGDMIIDDLGNCWYTPEALQKALDLYQDEVIEWANKQIELINNDDRIHYPIANIQTNAPLALIQLKMETERNQLEYLKSFLIGKDRAFTPKGFRVIKKDENGGRHSSHN